MPATYYRCLSIFDLPATLVDKYRLIPAPRASGGSTRAELNALVERRCVSQLCSRSRGRTRHDSEGGRAAATAHPAEEKRGKVSICRARPSDTADLLFTFSGGKTPKRSIRLHTLRSAVA